MLPIARGNNLASDVPVSAVRGAYRVKVLLESSHFDIDAGAVLLRSVCYASFAFRFPLLRLKGASKCLTHRAKALNWRRMRHIRILRSFSLILPKTTKRSCKITQVVKLTYLGDAYLF